MTRPRLRGWSAGGFTLVEVIVVVAILMIVAGIAVPAADRMVRKSKKDATTTEMRVLGSGLIQYLEEHQQWPESLGILLDDGYVGGGFSPSDLLNDAWSQPYSYTRTQEQATITSLGPDHASGGDDPQYTVDARPTLRALTRGEIETIHVALQAYEIGRSRDERPALPNNWLTDESGNGACRLLSEAGLLPNEEPYEKDAWGNVYVYGGSPADFVTSPSL